MSAGAWIMLVFGCALLYGGLAICLFRAAGSKQYTDADFEDSEDE